MKKTIIAVILLLTGLNCLAEDRFANVKIVTQQLTDNVYMLIGAGGNIGVSYGSDGLLMIDDQFGPLAPKIRSALKAIGNDTPTYLLNTHYHGDHTGSNADFGKASMIMAHENVRVRLVAGDAPEVALPVLTYQQQAHLYFNGEQIQIIHLPSGHTDGDSIAYFTKSDVVHMGDDFFKDRFPYVDLDAGGSVAGMIRNVEAALNIIGNDTQVIPGHGALANKSDVSRYLDMLKTTNATVKQAITMGKSSDAILAKGLPDKWDEWGTGFINEERWIQTLIRENS